MAINASIGAERGASPAEGVSRVVESFGYNAVHDRERRYLLGRCRVLRQNGISILKKPTGFFDCFRSPVLAGFLDFRRNPWRIRFYGDNNAQEIGELARELENIYSVRIRVDKVSDKEPRYLI